MARSIRELQEHKLVDGDALSELEQVADKFDVLITPYLKNLLKQTPSDHPLRKQFLPHTAELNEFDFELVDPTGDGKHEVVKGVIHRYPDRCLLKVVSVCPVYCRFCFRKEMIGPRSASLTKEELAGAYDYIKNNQELSEVILTGGDPLILKPARLAEIIASLASIGHIDVIRIHTRVPFVDPARIHADLISTLQQFKPIYIVVHANHPDEFTKEAIHACDQLVAAGIPLLSQSVLLKDINDDEEVLIRLMKKFIKHRIKPYYLHHPDLAKGTSHFRVSIEKGQQLVKALQRRISGLCQPTYVLEIPGGLGKMPIAHCYIHQQDETSWQIEDQQGNFHSYNG